MMNELDTLAITLVLCAAFTAPVLVSAEGPPNGTVEVTVRTGHDRGEVRCGLHSRSNWLEVPTKGTISSPKAGEAVCAFESIPHGSWAVAVHHDEDGDGEMKTNFIGLPKEGWGTSRNAQVSALGPPRFADARFIVSDKPVSLTIDLRY